MLQKPRWKECFHVELVEPNHVFLLMEDKHWLLTGRVYKAVAPFLDGNHTLGDLARRLEGTVSLPELYVALGQLEKAGYIVEDDPETDPEIAAFWHALDVNASAARRQFADTRVALKTLGNVDDGPLLNALKQQSVLVTDDGEFTVVVVDNYLNEELANLNRQMLASGQSWMLVRLNGHTPWIGPIFRHGQTACWECMAERLRINRQVESYLQKRSGRTAPLNLALSALPSTIEAGAMLASIEILKWLGSGTRSKIEGRLLTYNTLGSEMQSHVVVRRPQCPACGDPEVYRTVRPIVLQSAPKKFMGDGGHRTLFPEETFARNEHHISPLTGVVNWLVDITGEANGLAYSYIAGHNFAMGPDNVAGLLQSLRSRTGGKGMTEIQAKVSAIGEAVERYSGVWRGDEPVVRGSFETLGDQAIDPRTCLLFSDRQYANRVEWNTQRRGFNIHIVPNPFDEAYDLDWTPVWSLAHQEQRYLPAAYCYYGHPEANNPFFCMGDSNGCSAGNTLEEAILQGFLELVERDCAAMWWYNQAKRPAVDLDSFDLPYLRTLRSYYESLNRDLWVLDITSDLGIPAFVAVSRRVDTPVEDITIGLAAHLDPRIAMLRAVTEVNQFLPAVSKKAPDGSTAYSFPDGEAVEWWKTATIAKQAYLVPDSSVAMRRLNDFSAHFSSDVQTDVQACLENVQRVGLEMYVLDQTRPDIGMAVCRVIVPGMRHFWRRLGPGRLYDVPVQLGWLDRPTLEQDLNPYSIFF